MDNLNEILSKLTEFLKSETKTDTIIGEQFKLGEFTCVPVVAVGLGLGGGTGQGDLKVTEKAKSDGLGMGLAGGLGIGPVGFLVAKDDHIQFISIHASKGLSAVFEKVPDLLEKYLAKDKMKQPDKV